MSDLPAIPFGRPWITDADREAVVRVLDGHILTHGPECKAFEQEFGAFLGEEAACVTTSSCFAALHLAYVHFGISAGDEVIVPAQTHTATVHAVELVGATPVFVDCDVSTGNMSPERVEAAITPRTRAIGLVHFVGIPCQMKHIMAIAQQHKLFVIEDCALALGARFQGRHVGLFGDAGCFSFYPAKHMTTGEGGMFVSRHGTVADNVRQLRGFGVEKVAGGHGLPQLYDVPSLGFNYRMSEMQAALGRSQLRRMEENLTTRRSRFERLKAEITTQCKEKVRVLDTIGGENISSHYCLSMVLCDSLSERRNAIVASLMDQGVGTSVYYPHPVPRLLMLSEPRIQLQDE